MIGRVPPAAPAATLPDLVPLDEQQWYLERRDDGRSVLSFNTSVANVGLGTLEVNRAVPDGQPRQRIFDADGSFRDRPLDMGVVWHPEHRHEHLALAVEYQIRHANPDGSPGAPVAGVESAKTSFRLLDWHKQDRPGFDADPNAVDSDPGAPHGGRYQQWSGPVMGLSPGWTDVYYAFQAGQSLDVSNLAPGNYVLEQTIDPEHGLLETTRANNASYTHFEIPQPTQEIAKEHRGPARVGNDNRQYPANGAAPVAVPAHAPGPPPPAPPHTPRTP